MAEVGALREAVTRMTSQWASQEQHAVDGRRQLYERFENLSVQFAELNAKVGQAISDITKMQPTVRLFEDGQQQLKGMSRVAKVLWVGATGIAGLIGWTIHELWGGQPPHH